MRKRARRSSNHFLFLFSSILITFLLALTIIFLIRRHKSNLSAADSERRAFLVAPPPPPVLAKSKKIFAAFRAGDDEKLSELLDSIDPETNEEEYLKVLYDYSQLAKPHLAHVAISAGRLATLKIILDSNLVNVNDLFLVHHAIKNVKTSPDDVLTMILEGGADLDLPDQYKNPPIAVAINYNNLAALKFLLDKRAKVNVAFAHSPSFLHHAVSLRSPNLEIIKELLLNHANVYHYGPDGRTAFHHALYLRPYNPVLIDLFLTTHPPNMTADLHLSHLINFPTSPKQVKKPSKATRYGYSPLHIAVSTFNHRLVKLLLEKGADRTRRDTTGLTPLQLSQQLKHPKIPEILQC